MRTTTLLRAALLTAGVGVLGALPARATTVQSSTLQPGCSGACVDVWEISCPYAGTHGVYGRVKNPKNALPTVRYTAVGLIKPARLLGTADVESTTHGPELYAGIDRPAYQVGSTKILLTVSSDTTPLGYQLEAKCADTSGKEVGNPSVTLKQGQ